MCMRTQGIKPSSKLVILCAPRHNEGAEVPSCGMMLIVSCPHLTPSDHPHPIISLAPQFLFQPFSAHFFLFSYLLSAILTGQWWCFCHRLLHSPILWSRLLRCPGYLLCQATALTSPPHVQFCLRQHCWLGALLPSTPSCLTLAQSILQLLLLLKCIRVSPQTWLSHACS